MIRGIHISIAAAALTCFPELPKQPQAEVPSKTYEDLR
jgi:hypothetical protein